MPMKEPAFHGTKASPKRLHPVLDLDFFRQHCEFEEKHLQSTPGWLDSPRSFVHADLVLSKARATVGLGKPVPVDFFTWAYERFPKPQNLTRLGGLPWRDAVKAWPKSAKGVPLLFIGQFNLQDSLDLFDRKFPGEVVLLFAESLDLYTGEIYVEWAPAKIRKPTHYADVPPHASHGLTLSGVIHRDSHYPHADDALEKAGLKPFYVGAVRRATQIGLVGAGIQDEPFDGREGVQLIAILSAVILKHSSNWPLVNVASLPTYITPNGQSLEFSPWELEIGDAGACYVGVDKKGALFAECSLG